MHDHMHDGDECFEHRDLFIVFMAGRHLASLAPHMRISINQNQSK
jgi:hypothetical protein